MNGKEGLTKAQGYLPDLVLLDVMLPEVDGFEVCRRLKNSSYTKNIPVLLLTALNETNDKVKGLDAGADDFLPKPFKDAELQARLRSHLRTKRLHDELIESYKKLKEMESLKDSLVHLIVHDLRAPLTVVKESINVLIEQATEKSGSWSEETQGILQGANRHCSLQANLIDDILDLNRLEEEKVPLHKTEVDLCSLAHSCVEMFEAQGKKDGINCACRFPEALPRIQADESMTRRILINLIGNSLKFTDEGGKITVHLKESDRFVECAVEDDGVGIPNEHLNRIFDKFFQIDSTQVSRRGKGLGLAFCRLAVEAHGGRIWAENKEGGGSRFVFKLPIA